MTSNIAESASRGLEHAYAPSRARRHLPNMFWSEFWRCRKAIAQILVALTKDLKIKCQNQRGAAGIFRSFNEVFYEITVFHHIELEPERLFGHSSHIFDGADAHCG